MSTNNIVNRIDNIIDGFQKAVWAQTKINDCQFQNAKNSSIFLSIHQYQVHICPIQFVKIQTGSRCVTK